MRPDLTVVLPTYNEVDTLEQVTAGIRSIGAEVVVVDDGSPDGTGRLADRLAASDAGITALHRRTKQGLGAAYAAAFGVVVAREVPLIGQMDADGSHDPGDLERLAAALDEGADVAIGSRYVPGGTTTGWSLPRRVLSGGANRYVRLALGVRTRDATAGYRVYRRDALVALDPRSCRSAGYVFQVEMTYRAERGGMRIVEVPIEFVERRGGSSKMSPAVAIEAAWRITLWGLLRLWRALRSSS